MKLRNRLAAPIRLATFFSSKARRLGMNGDFSWYLSRKGVLSNWRLEMLRGRHWGKRCFLIGNGPSLKTMDLRPLANEFTIGLNRVYLLFDEIGFATTYYVCVNKLVVEQCAEEIVRVPAIRFINWNARDLIPFTRDMILLRPLFHPHFSKDLTVGMWEGSTVTYVAMQVAHHLGFHQVILVGVDHDYQAEGQPNMEVVSQGDDPDHFAPDYFAKGFRWQLPDLYRSEVAYRIAKLAFEQDNREIVDATVGGKLEIFRKVSYETLIDSGG